MKLAEYLEALYNGKGGRPTEDIVLPDEMRELFDNLYEMSEKKGAEHGCALFYDRKTQTFTASKIEGGLKTSMTIPESDDPTNFGNVHAHPSASIGHKGGYSPHSTQDLLTFAKTTDRPFFIQFVVSGPKVYAMIYIKGISVWSKEVATFLNTRRDQSEMSVKKLLHKAAGGVDKYVDTIGSMDSAKAEEYLDSLKRTVRNYGKLMEETAHKDCKDFATKYKYVYISWDYSVKDDDNDKCLVM